MRSLRAILGGLPDQPLGGRELAGLDGEAHPAADRPLGELGTRDDPLPGPDGRLISPPRQLAGPQEVDDPPVRVRLPGQELLQFPARGGIATGHDIRLDLRHRDAIVVVDPQGPAAPDEPRRDEAGR